MTKSIFLSLFSAVLFSLIIVFSAFAQSSKAPVENKTDDKTKVNAEPTPAPVIKTGVIASTAQSKSMGGVAIGAVVDEQGAFGEKVAIDGGVTNNSGSCRATINNSNKEIDFRVRFKVKGISRGKKVFSKSFSGKVKKGGRLKKEFTCNKEAQLQLELISARPLK